MAFTMTDFKIQLMWEAFDEAPPAEKVEFLKRLIEVMSDEQRAELRQSLDDELARRKAAARKPRRKR